MDDFKAGAAWARRNELDDATLTGLETAVAKSVMGVGAALAQAYMLGHQRGRAHGPLPEEQERDDAEHARKRATKIRESYLASVRANVNLLASMTATERFNVIPNLAPDVWARGAARALMVETWGEDAVAAALGGGS